MKKFLTKFLPSTITRFCERITRLIRPVSPLSLPLIIITCNSQAQQVPQKKIHIMLKKKQIVENELKVLFFPYIISSDNLPMPNEFLSRFPTHFELNTKRKAKKEKRKKKSFSNGIK